MLIGALAMLAAAAAAQPPASPRATSISEAWLVGGWVPEGENCASDAGMILNADRSWASEGTIGTWRVVRNRLVMTATFNDDGNPRERIVPPRRYAQRIESAEQDAFVARHEDGTVLRWVRCPR